MSYIYLAAPYTDPDEGVMESRAEAIDKVYVHFLNKGNVVYSPISSNHHIAKRFELPRDWEFWKNFDSTFVEQASKVYVLMLPGWCKSKGVTEEVNIARKSSIPVFGIRPLTYDKTQLI